MPGAIFEERPIAVIWDFDKTLIPGSMQWPLFQKYGINEGEFWDETNALAEYYRRQGLDLVSSDTLYLNHILSYVRAGKFKGLSNKVLRELGEQIKFYKGLPEFFQTTAERLSSDVFTELNIKVEHYIVSTGLRQMIRGSRINDYVDGIWACEFTEKVAEPGYDMPADDGSAQEAGQAGPEIQDIIYTINNTTKTRAIFEINKGANREQIDVNASIAAEDRRVPFENMIYVADGPSDVPVFSIPNQYGGQTYAVYKPGDRDEFRQVDELAQQGRINAFGPADYRLGKQTAMWIEAAIDRAAERMVRARGVERRAGIAERVGSAPRHLEADRLR